MAEEITQHGKFCPALYVVYWYVYLPCRLHSKKNYN